MYKYLCGWLLLVWWLVCPAAWAAPLLLDDTGTQLFPELSLLEDPSAQLTLTEVMAKQAQFQPVASQQHRMGYTRSAWWLRFDVTQTGKQAWWLLLDTRNNYEVDVYAEPLDGSADVKALAREAGFLMPVFAPDFEQGQVVRFYVRLTNHFSPLAFQASLVPADQVIATTQPRLLFMIATLGGVLSLAVYNLFLYFSFRDTSYLQLFIFTVALSAQLMSQNGMLYLLVKSEVLFNLLLPLPSLLALASGVGFFRQLIRTAESVPFVDKLMAILTWMALFIIVLSPFLPVTDAWVAGFGMFVLPLAIVSTLQASRRGYRVARSFIYALLVLTVGAMPAILMAAAIIPDSVYALYTVHAGFLGFVLLLSLTQVEHTRALREANERAQAASKAKTEFLTTMSHELRTPMNAVVGIGGLMRMTPLNTEQRDYLDKLDVSSRHMLHLIDDILDFSRIEQRGLDVSRQPFQLTTVLEDVSGILRDQAQRKGLVFECSCYPSVYHGLLLGDATRLSQVLLNLAGNAIKFTDSGQVVLSVHEQENWLPEQVSLQFAVKDTGIGISAEQLRHLFQPFAQVEVESHKHYDGFGLGLVISQRLVQAMGGELQVDSVVGQGSCFYFTLLFAKQGNAPPLPEPVSAGMVAVQDSPPKHILVVDDDEINRFVARRFLESRLWQVTLAEDGQAALDILRHADRQQVDLVLMDVDMPVMDGYEATRQLRAMGLSICQSLP